MICTRTGFEKIEQASLKEGVHFDEDRILKQSELIAQLASDLGVSKLCKDEDGWLVYNNLKISIKNISYLGFKKNAKRSHKKRIQFSNNLINSYLENPDNKIILGHYVNKLGERLYVKFELSKDKIGKSKSSHVLVDDLQCGFLYNSFTKIDKRKNVVTVITPSFIIGAISDNKLSLKFIEFGHHVLKNNKWNYKSSIKAMLNDGYKDARQTEWAGWYLEYLASKYFALDGDVQIPSKESFGSWTPDAFHSKPIEIKYHSIGKDDIPGNDIEGVMEAIKKYNSISLFVASGKSVNETVRGEVTNWRLNILGKPLKKPTDIKKLLKKTVEVKEIGWCNISKETADKLKFFSQGKNSNGKPRKVKFMYSTKILEDKII